MSVPTLNHHYDYIIIITVIFDRLINNIIMTKNIEINTCLCIRLKKKVTSPILLADIKWDFIDFLEIIFCFI